MSRFGFLFLSGNSFVSQFEKLNSLSSLLGVVMISVPLVVALRVAFAFDRVSNLWGRH